VRNGFYYQKIFLDRIYRIDWIFYSRLLGRKHGIPIAGGEEKYGRFHMDAPVIEIAYKLME